MHLMPVRLIGPSFLAAFCSHGGVTSFICIGPFAYMELFLWDVIAQKKG